MSPDAEALRGRESLVGDIDKILFDCDPIGVHGDTPADTDQSGSPLGDEFRLEAQLVLTAMDQNPPTDILGCLEVVHDVFTVTFGSEIAGSAERYRRPAEQIFASWRHRQRDSSDGQLAGPR